MQSKVAGSLSKRPWVGLRQHQLSYPLPFQRSLDSNGPDKVISICLWNVGSCIHWTPHCCDSAHDPSHRMQLHTAINHLHIYIYKDIRYVTRIPYISPQTCRNGFPKVAARQSTGARGSVQCRGRPRMNAEAYVLDWRRVSIVESLQSCYHWGSIQWSAILWHTSTHNVRTDIANGYLRCLLYINNHSICYKQTLGCSCTYAVEDSGSIRRRLWMLWVHVKPL